MYEAMNDVLYINNSELGKVIADIKNEAVPDNDLILRLSVIKARSEVLEIFTDIDMVGTSFEGAGEANVPPPEPVPYFISEVENDDPETEDKDLKKIRQESKGFFG